MFPPDTPPGDPAATPPVPAPTDPPADPPAAAGTADPPSPGTTGADRRIRELNDRAKAAEKAAAEAAAKLKEIEERDLSEKEKAEKKAAEAEQKAQAAEARAIRLERTGIARAAAMEAQFIDPEDAVSLLDLEDLDTDAKIKSAVTKLAEAKPHLVGRAQPGQGFGNPGGVGQPTSPGGIPLDEEGKPDEKLGLGQDLLAHLRRSR